MQRGRAVGEPGAAVEQVAGLVEQGEVEGDEVVTETLQLGPRLVGGVGHRHRERPAATGHGAEASTDSTTRPSATVRENVETQSMLGLAGTTPSTGRDPGAPFSPTTPHMAAGTRPEPAVSVPRVNATSPSATATAEPDDEPPGIKPASNGLRGTP